MSARRCRSAARPAYLVVAALSLGLVLNQVALMALPAVIVDLTRAWSLDAQEIGWLGGIYFAGYAVALPLASGLADRMGGRRVYAASAVLAAIASGGFALLVEGFWSALFLRLLAGAAFSGAHIVGMKLLADRLAGDAQARAGALYSAAYALGSGASFFVAGPLGALLGWQAVFIVAALCALASLFCLALVGPALPGSEETVRRWFPDFAAALRQPEVRRYVLAYAGNTWEVFAIRIWFVPFLAFNTGLHAAPAPFGMGPPVLAGISAILAVPVSIAVAELGFRIGRARIICFVSLLSVVVCGLLGMQAGGPYALVVGLLMLHGATSYGDAGTINAGIVAASKPASRAAQRTSRRGSRGSWFWL